MHGLLICFTNPGNYRYFSVHELQFVVKRKSNEINDLNRKTTAFRVRCFQPLSHLSEAVSPTPIPLKTQAIHADLAVPISPSERFSPALAAFPLSRAFANQHSSLASWQPNQLAATLVSFERTLIPRRFVRPQCSGHVLTQVTATVPRASHPNSHDRASSPLANRHEPRPDCLNVRAVYMLHLKPNRSPARMSGVADYNTPETPDGMTGRVFELWSEATSRRATQTSLRHFDIIKNTALWAQR